MEVEVGEVSKVKLKCNKLLDQFKHTYEKHQQDLKDYQQKLRLWHERMDQILKAEEENQQKRKWLEQSQYVEWQGGVFDCSQSGHVEQLERCHCQKLYKNRPHLNSSLNSNLNLQQCTSKGHLDNRSVELLLWPSSTSNLEVDPGQEPSEPILQFPSITCSMCRAEFEDLIGDFSYANLVKVQQCINSDSNSTRNRNDNTDTDDDDNSNAFQKDSKFPIDSDSQAMSVEPIILSDSEAKQYSNLQQAAMIAAILILVAFSIYLVYCIYRNVPVDTVCSKVSFVDEMDNELE